jgi:hypothetical protein
MSSLYSFFAALDRTVTKVVSTDAGHFTFAPLTGLAREPWREKTLVGKTLPFTRSLLGLARGKAGPALRYTF